MYANWKQRGEQSSSCAGTLSHSGTKMRFHFTMKLCNTDITGPVFSHAADNCYQTLFKSWDSSNGICAWQICACLLFILHPKSMRLKIFNTTEFQLPPIFLFESLPYTVWPNRESYETFFFLNMPVNCQIHITKTKSNIHCF